VHDHPQQRQRLERGEKASDRQPVIRRPNPEVMMAKAEDAGSEYKCDLDVEPGLNDPARGSSV